MALLEVQDIHTYYGDAYVIQGLTLKLEQGQILGLLGRNGVGKTTLVNSIMGFNPPRRGKIVFKGTDITEIASFETVRSGIGLVPQGRRVFATLSVEETSRSPSATRIVMAGTWNVSMRCSRACANGVVNAPRRSRAVSSRCLPSAAG